MRFFLWGIATVLLWQVLTGPLEMMNLNLTLLMIATVAACVVTKLDELIKLYKSQLPTPKHVARDTQDVKN